MPLPGDINTITLTGTYLDMRGNALSGTVTFTPSTPLLVDGVSNKILGGLGVTVALSSGSFSVVLPCTGQLLPAAAGVPAATAKPDPKTGLKAHRPNARGRAYLNRRMKNPRTDRS